MMRVEQIWRYPVKSMIGEQVPATEVAATGVVGDRAWATRDHVRGGIRGAKQIGGLMRLASRYPDGPGGAVQMTFPDGATASTDDVDVDARLSAALDHQVTLESLRPPSDLDHYRRGPPDHDDLLVEMRAMFGREGTEPLPDLSGFPPEIFEYESPPGTYHDAYPLMVVTTSALRSLQEAVPDSAVDVRRFRPSVVVDTGEEDGHPETSWIGRRVRLGEVVLDVASGCPRCVMITREVTPDVPQDRSILRHIVRDLDQDLGVYATVVEPGRLAVGDEVTVE